MSRWGACRWNESTQSTCPTYGVSPGWRRPSRRGCGGAAGNTVVHSATRRLSPCPATADATSEESIPWLGLTDPLRIERSCDSADAVRDGAGEAWCTPRGAGALTLCVGHSTRSCDHRD